MRNKQKLKSRLPERGKQRYEAERVNLAALQDQDPKGGGKSKDGETPKGKGKGEAKECMRYSKPTGCKEGGKCTYYHPQLLPSEGRCFNCGAPDHSFADCDEPKRERKTEESTAPAIKSVTDAGKVKSQEAIAAKAVESAAKAANDAKSSTDPTNKNKQRSLSRAHRPQ